MPSLVRHGKAPASHQPAPNSSPQTYRRSNRTVEDTAHPMLTQCQRSRLAMLRSKHMSSAQDTYPLQQPPQARCFSPLHGRPNAATATRALCSAPTTCKPPPAARTQQQLLLLLTATILQFPTSLPQDHWSTQHQHAPSASTISFSPHGVPSKQFQGIPTALAQGSSLVPAAVTAPACPALA